MEQTKTQAELKLTATVRHKKRQVRNGDRDENIFFFHIPTVYLDIIKVSFIHQLID